MGISLEYTGRADCWPMRDYGFWNYMDSYE
jgi:hypothetical protein